MLEIKAREKDGDKKGLRRMAVKIMDLAEEGEQWAATFIRDTVDGKPVTAVEMTGTMEHDVTDPVKDMLMRIAGEGKRLAGVDDSGN